MIEKPKKFKKVGGFALRQLKKLGTLCLVMILSFGILAACKNSDEEDTITTATEITWWVSPVFAEEGETPFIQELATSFCTAHPKATIKITLLPAGEEQSYLEKAKQEGNMPDAYFGPLSSVENLGGKYTDFSSLLTEESTLAENFKSQGDLAGDGTLTFYPIVAQPYLLAFNKTMLEENDALALLPTDGDRQWTMEEYTQVMAALREKLPTNKDVGIFPYGSEEGDIATKALVLNAYGAGTMENISTEAGIQGLTAMQGLMKNNKLATDEITVAEDTTQPNYLVNGFDTPVAQALSSFLKGDSAQTLIYSLDTDLTTDAKTEPFEVLFMPYPSNTTPNIPYELLGMVAFDNGDENKTLASTVFTDYVANNEEWREKVCGYAGGISTNTAYNGFLSGEYAYLAETIPFMGEYQAYGYESENEKLAWMVLLRDVTFYGEDISASLATYSTIAAGGGAVATTDESTTTSSAA